MQKRVNMFFSRRGQFITRQMLIHLGMLALLAFIAVTLIGYIKSIENDTGFHKIFLSRDLALLTNTIYSVPGNVEYVYRFERLDLSKFNFEFKELSDTDDRPIAKVESEGLGKTYPYARPLGSKDFYSISSSNSINFSKNNNKLTVK